MPLEICLNPKINYAYKTIINKNLQENNEKDNWNISIPKINLTARIKDGTDQETLNNYVAHFEKSACIKGNICLAAHNRGYKVNYFKDLKQLQKGDEILYEFKSIKLKYLVTQNEIINDTDIQVIADTEENIITLITCVENQPEKRRCVRGKLIE